VASWSRPVGCSEGWGTAAVESIKQATL
jgi:hypothetical protein